ncbi:MAG: hypothetical protein J6C84_05450 [Lachnospiraceae bacterium]|nr:hypothetical protein [Lachnospiraceae bacterium]
MAVVDRYIQFPAGCAGCTGSGQIRVLHGMTGLTRKCRGTVILLLV